MTFTEAILKYELNEESSSFQTSGYQDEAVARKILTEVMRFRRISDPHTACDIETCQECASPHLPKIISAV